MSSVYVLEPPTKGKVVLNTTVGPLDVELWPKEAPKAVRNFVQLCLEGYYNTTIFHRIIKSFMVQAGDRSGTGVGGETIYGAPFPDEFHTRLKFRHRGLVACANAGTPNSNNSQFFITLDRCEWLDKKNTIFGKVTGDSLYNLLKIGEVETDKDDRPVDTPPQILSIEVLWNPFDDIVPREAPRKSEDETSETLNKDNKKKAVKKLNLLSFGDEAEEEEKVLATVKGKIKSSHDVLNDPRLLKGSTDTVELDPLEIRRKHDIQVSVREALSVNKHDTNVLFNDKNSSDDDEADFDAKMREKILRKRQQFGDLKSENQAKLKEKAVPKIEEKVLHSRREVEEPDDIVRPEKLSLKKKGLGSDAKEELSANGDLDAQLLGPAEQRRQMFKQRKRRQQGREDDTLAKLQKFKSALQQTRLTSINKSENADDNEEDESDWLTHQLKFNADGSKKDDMTRKDDPDAYEVHDPLLEKGKEKFNKMQAKLKRRQREWAGKSLA